MATRLRRIVLLLAISSPHAFGQASVPLLQSAVRQTTSNGFRDRLQSLSSLVHACREDAKACNPAAVGDDDKIVSPDDTFQVRWQWLRRVLADARDPAYANRLSLLDQAAARLDQEFVESEASLRPQPAFAPARREADSILARPEFRVVSGESWLDRKIAEFWAWFYRIFTAASNLGRHAPWLGRVLEWGFVGLSVVVVLVWVARTMERERLAISLSGALPSRDWQKESDDWAALARVEAENGDWRAAVHCLYWASVVVLESRKLWRRDPARTPREYVNLLESDSPQQRNLRAITRIFERIWYGLKTAAREDYAQALALFEDMRGA